MAGEWIPIDCNLADKPEVLELMDETSEPIEVVVYRLLRLWSWAALNTADGTLRATPSRLKHVAGGSEDFWLAVERVGWVQFSDGNVMISGWDKRFSQAAKARAQANKRQDSYRKRKGDAAPSQDGDAVPSQVSDATASPQDRRGQDKRREEKKPRVIAQTKPQAVGQGQQAISWNLENGWQGITDADRQEWALAYPAADLTVELAKATQWLKANPKKAKKSNWRRWLTTVWLSRCQDSGGTHRKPGNRPDDKPPPERWLDQYQPAEYKRPRQAAAVAEAAAIAKACRIPE